MRFALVRGTVVVTQTHRGFTFAHVHGADVIGQPVAFFFHSSHTVGTDSLVLVIVVVVVLAAVVAALRSSHSASAVVVVVVVVIVVVASRLFLIPNLCRRRLQRVKAIDRVIVASFGQELQRRLDLNSCHCAAVHLVRRLNFPTGNFPPRGFSPRVLRDRHAHNVHGTIALLRRHRGWMVLRTLLHRRTNAKLHVRTDLTYQVAELQRPLIRRFRSPLVRLGVRRVVRRDIRQLF